MKLVQTYSEREPSECTARTAEAPGPGGAVREGKDID